MDLRTEVGRADYATKIIGDTNILDNAEFLAMMFAIINMRYDWKFNFKDVIINVCDMLIDANIDLFDTGHNLAGLLYNEENTN